MAGIARGTQRTRAKVVDNACRDAPKDDADINGGVTKNIGGGLDHLQQRVRHTYGKQRHNQRQHAAEPATVPEKAPEFRMVPAAHCLRQRNAKADAAALYKAENKKPQRMGAAYGGKRLLAQKASYHHGIDKGIQLLKQRTRHKRQREHQQLAHRRALR